jgi:hypothetical protein
MAATNDFKVGMVLEPGVDLGSELFLFLPIVLHVLLIVRLLRLT